MKKTFLLFTILISIFSFSQIRIDNSPNSILVGKITAGSISLEKLDRKYTICYDDAKFTKVSSLKCFSFLDVENDFENFYALLLDGFNNPPKENIKLDFPNDNIEIHYEKMMGVVSMQFIQYFKEANVYGYSSYITKKQLQKLFGKNK